MEINNPFRKNSPRPVRAPGVDELQALASAFVASVIDRAEPDQSRVIELAVKNGSLSVTVDISPTPAVRINLEPGAPIALDVVNS